MIIPKSADSWVGTLFVLTGVYALAWWPTLKKRLAKRQESGELTAEEVRFQLKMLKMIIILELVMGGSAICIYAFDLYD